MRPQLEGNTDRFCCLRLAVHVPQDLLRNLCGRVYIMYVSRARGTSWRQYAVCMRSAQDVGVGGSRNPATSTWPIYIPYIPSTQEIEAHTSSRHAVCIQRVAHGLPVITWQLECADQCIMTVRHRRHGPGSPELPRPTRVWLVSCLYSH